MTEPPHPEAEPTWSGDFRDAENAAFEGSLAATPSQRLRWLEEALAFAWRMGALKPRVIESPDGDSEPSARF